MAEEGGGGGDVCYVCAMLLFLGCLEKLGVGKGSEGRVISEFGRSFPRATFLVFSHMLRKGSPFVPYGIGDRFQN